MVRWISLGVMSLVLALYWSRHIPRSREPSQAEPPEENAARHSRAERRTPRGRAPEEDTRVPPKRFIGEDAELAKLPREQLDAYIARCRTNVDSLIAAFQVSQDKEYLRIAATNFPNNPLVQLSVITHDVFPEQKREWMERLKQTEPDNALANYLSAREHFQN